MGSPIEGHKGVQFVSMRYTEHLTNTSITSSVGSKADNYHNAHAASCNGLYTTEPIHRRGPWKNADSVESATSAYSDWFNNQRLHGAIGMLPLAEFETTHYAHTTATITTGTHTTKVSMKPGEFRLWFPPCARTIRY